MIICISPEHLLLRAQYCVVVSKFERNIYRPFDWLICIGNYFQLRKFLGVGALAYLGFLKWDANITRTHPFCIVGRRTSIAVQHDFKIEASLMWRMRYYRINSENLLMNRSCMESCWVNFGTPWCVTKCKSF